MANEPGAPTPFDTIESALEFVQLLQEEAVRTRDEMARLIENEPDPHSRQVEALRLVVHKLKQLSSYMESSERVLHDLQSLRTLLLR
jgi:PP-loop superfamily ATP-utilizing enzyme